MGKSLFLIPAAGGGCWMSDHSEERAGDLFAIALYLHHRCTAKFKNFMAFPTF